VDIFYYNRYDKREGTGLESIVRNIALGTDVLLWRETGAGKDYLALRIHTLSGRTGRLIAMSSAAISESLAENELFGVVSGAYTGPNRSRMGTSKLRRSAGCISMKLTAYASAFEPSC
jgi:transcriptional regulator with GAF, ATPase, and Fis domain